MLLNCSWHEKPITEKSQQGSIEIWQLANGIVTPWSMPPTR